MDNSGGSENQRRHGRVVCQEIPSTLGEVLDISASGARILCTNKPFWVGHSGLSLTIFGVNGPITLRAKIVWSTKQGWRKHVLGLQFVELSPEMMHAITSIGRACASNEVMRPFLKNARESA